MKFVTCKRFVGEGYVSKSSSKVWVIQVPLFVMLYWSEWSYMLLFKWMVHIAIKHLEIGAFRLKHIAKALNRLRVGSLEKDERNSIHKIIDLLNCYAWILLIILQEPMGHNNTMAFYFGQYGPCCFVVWFERLLGLRWFEHDNKVLHTFKEMWKDIFSNKAHRDCCIV